MIERRRCGAADTTTSTLPDCNIGAPITCSGASVGRSSIVGLASDYLWRPIAPPTRQPNLRRFPFKIGGRLDEVRFVHIVEGIDVEHPISIALYHTRYNRHTAARRAYVKIRGLRSEPV